jgi:hypothetical protein
MKKYNRFLIALLAVSALTVSACKESFLDLDPNNAITDQNFYQTQTDAIRAVNATYTPLQGLYNGAAWQILDIMSDDTDKGGGGANDGVEVYELDNFTLTSFNPMINTYYVQNYLGVQRANIVLDKVPAISEISSSVKSRCLGEAYFLRGYYYFMLVRLFGDVPLYTAPISLDEAFKIPRSPKAQVYETIIADLNKAAELLPKTRFTGDDAGRVNSWTAKGLLSSVYLTMGNKQLAAQNAIEVINSNVYNLNSNYANNFSLTNENGIESLFEVQYRTTGQTWNFFGQGQALNTFMGPRAENLVASSGYGFNVPTPEFVANYEKNAAGAIIDTRRSPSMWMPGDKFDTYTQKASLEGSPNGYNVRKYFVPATNVNADAGGWSCALNVPILRFSEVLLIAAEASGPGAGDQYINRVRTRAGLPNIQSSLSDAAFLEAVYKERRVELAFEMHRWFDLIRHPDPNYMVTTMNAAGKNAQTKHMLMPIPQGERDKNPNLTQNAGY